MDRPLSATANSLPADKPGRRAYADDDQIASGSAQAAPEGAESSSLPPTRAARLLRALRPFFTSAATQRRLRLAGRMIFLAMLLSPVAAALPLDSPSPFALQIPPLVAAQLAHVEPGGNWQKIDDFLRKPVEQQSTRQEAEERQREDTEIAAHIRLAPLPSER